jgi:hypothetical protein
LASSRFTRSRSCSGRHSKSPATSGACTASCSASPIIVSTSWKSSGSSWSTQSQPRLSAKNASTARQFALVRPSPARYSSSLCKLLLRANKSRGLKGHLSRLLQVVGAALSTRTRHRPDTRQQTKRLQIPAWLPYCSAARLGADSEVTTDLGAGGPFSGFRRPPSLKLHTRSPRASLYPSRLPPAAIATYCSSSIS